MSIDVTHTLYRTMKADADGFPRTGRSAKLLGVRVVGPHADVVPNAAGDVHPGGGMSVVVDDLYSLAPHRLPQVFGGSATDTLWGIPESMIASPLALRPARLPHMHVEPLVTMPLPTFEVGLAATRTDWRAV